MCTSIAYCRLSLPVIRLTKRPAVGEKSLQFLDGRITAERSGVPCGNVAEKADWDGGPTEESISESVTAVDSFPPPDMPEPSFHELESRASAAGWDKIRNKVMKVVTENAAMPIAQVCLKCEGLASLRCQECGPLGFYCSGCFEVSHGVVNLFHLAEKWEVYTCTV